MIFSMRQEYGGTHLFLKMTCDSAGWPELLEAFEDFLRGCGFHFAGYFDLVEEPDDAKSRAFGGPPEGPPKESPERPRRPAGD